MSKRRRYKSHKKGHDKFVQIHHFIMDTVAWKTLKPAHRALYVELKRQYNGYNNGRILLSYRDAAKRLNVSYNSVGGWFKELEKCGFIICMQRHHLGPSGVGQTSHWRLTEHDCDGLKATHDYRNWTPAKK